VGWRRGRCLDAALDGRDGRCLDTALGGRDGRCLDTALDGCNGRCLDTALDGCNGRCLDETFGWLGRRCQHRQPVQRIEWRRLQQLRLGPAGFIEQLTRCLEQPLDE
jgi:hypothetical protein